MPGIAIPRDRTIKQQSKGYCLNPDCRPEGARRFEYPVNNDLFACPKCGANAPPTVGLLVMTHMLIADAQGPIQGAHGKRYRIACASSRAYLATVTNQEAAVGEPALVDCIGCLAEMERLKLNTIQGFKLER